MVSWLLSWFYYYGRRGWRVSLRELISIPQLNGTMHDSLTAPQSSMPIEATQKGKRKTPSKLDPIPNLAPISQLVVVAPTPPPSLFYVFLWSSIMSFHCLSGQRSQHKGIVRGLQSWGLNFIIVDILEDLYVPHLSRLPHSIPKWNKHNVHDVEAIFEFGDAYLHDDVVVLLVVHESTKV